MPKIKTRIKSKQKITKPGITPLHGSFMITAFIGLMLTIFFVIPASLSWGTAFLIFFAVMFIAALISMTKAPIRE